MRPMPIVASITVLAIVFISGAALVSGVFQGSDASVELSIDAVRSEDAPYCKESRHFCVVELTRGNFVALYMTDTHELFRKRGCRVHWEDGTRIPFGFDGQGFRAKCSGSQFDPLGNRTFGPSPRNLDRLEVEVTAGTLIVHTDRLLCAESLIPAPCELAPADR